MEQHKETERLEYPDGSGTFCFATGPETFEYAVDIARLTYALLKCRIGIKGTNFEDWQAQYAARFRVALKNLRYKAIERGDRHGSLPQLLYDKSLADGWGAIKEAENLIEAFLGKQNP